MQPIVDLILLNWNGSDETFCAYKSVVSSRVSPNKVIVVDNHSSSEDYKKLIELFSDSITFEESPSCHEQLLLSEKVVIARNCFNSGYAGGNNLGIQLAIEINNPDYFWVLNNDALPDDEALNELLACTSQARDSFVSSVTLYQEGKKIESYGGGTYFPLFGKAKLLHKNQQYRYDLPVRLNYLMGASLLVPAQVITDVGYMDECFFMYSEEVDWQWRAEKLGYKLKVARKSIVYHAGSGSSSHWGYHYYRNRAAIMFNSIHFGCLFSIMSSIVLASFMLIKYFSQPRVVVWGIRGCLAGICKTRSDKLKPL